MNSLSTNLKKKTSSNKWTVGGSSATSPRRNITAIIFKQAASGRSVFSSGTRRYSNRRLDRLSYFRKYANVSWKCDLLVSYHPSPPFRTRWTFLFSSPFSLTDFPFRHSKKECEWFMEVSGKRNKFDRKEKKNGEKRKSSPIFPSSERKKSSSILLVQLMCIMCNTLSLLIVLRCDFNKFLLLSIAIGAFSSYKTCFAILLIRSRKIEG